MTKKKHPLACSLCRLPIDIEPLSGWAGGHNAQPLNNGRCCSYCNSMYVIPARLAAMGLIKKQESPAPRTS